MDAGNAVNNNRRDINQQLTRMSAHRCIGGTGRLQGLKQPDGRSPGRYTSRIRESVASDPPTPYSAGVIDPNHLFR